MTDLSPDLKKLVNIAHDAMSPTEQQVDAVRNALKARLGETPPQGGGPAGGGGAALGAWSALQIVGIACVALGVVVGGVELWGRSSGDARPVREQPVLITPPPTAAGELAQPAEVAPHEEARVEKVARKLKARRERVVIGKGTSPAPAPASTAASTTASASTTTATATTANAAADAAGRSEEKAADKTLTSGVRAGESEAQPAADLLAQEVDLLKRARAALTHGQPAVALALADQHASRFPHGVLRQEQLATRMRALCALGRSSDARGVLHELESTSRRSPHLMSIDARCLKEARREGP